MIVDQFIYTCLLKSRKKMIKSLQIPILLQNRAKISNILRQYRLLIIIKYN